MASFEPVSGQRENLVGTRYRKGLRRIMCQRWKDFAGASAAVFVCAAHAGPIIDQFAAQAYDTTTTNTLAYRYAHIIGPEFDSSTGLWVVTEKEEAGAGTTEVSASSGPFGGVSRATVQFGQQTAYATANGGTSSGVGSYPQMKSRDVWTVTGGTGTGTMVIRGHAEGTMTGEYAYFNSVVQALSVGSFGSLGGEYGTTFFKGSGISPITVTSTTCGEAYASQCTPTVNGNTVRVDWSITVPFEYGGRTYVWPQVEAAASGGGEIAAQASADVRSSIDSIELPAGAVLSASSGSLFFYNNAYHYTPPPVVERRADVSVTAIGPKKIAKRTDGIEVAVTLRNSGPDAPMRTNLSVPVPRGLLPVGVVPSGGCGEFIGCVFWLNPLTPNTYLVRYIVDPAFPAERDSVTINAEAFVSDDVIDPSLLNNRASVTVSIPKAPRR